MQYVCLILTKFNTREENGKINQDDVFTDYSTPMTKL